MKSLAALLVFAATAALAGIVTTEAPGPHVMHAPDGTSKGFATHAECVAALPLGRGTCSAVTNVEKVGVCDEPAPVDPPRYDANGLQILPELVVSGDWATTTEAGYVAGPAYPDCWVMGWVPYTGDWHAPEGPPVMEPVYPPGEAPPP